MYSITSESPAHPDIVTLIATGIKANSTRLKVTTCSI